MVLGSIAVLFWVNHKEKQGNKGRSIQHCLDCSWLNLQDPSFDPHSILEKESQVIIYSRNLTWDLATFNMDWKKIQEEFPDLTLIFYYGGKSEEKILNWIEEKNVDFPVIFDPEDSFRKSNLEGDMSGVVLNCKRGEVISLMNPTFGEDYRLFLKENYP